MCAPGRLGEVSFRESDIKEIIKLLKYDKKNSHGNILFVLLEEIGKPAYNQLIDNELIYEAFEDYEKFNA